MQTSKKGLNALKYFEGERLTAYKCSAGVWTIGVGHTGSLQLIGKDRLPKEGDKITKAQSTKLLQADIEYFEQAVERLVKVPLTQAQFDSLVSFAFNCGVGALQQSTLLKRVNARDTAENISSAFKMWCKAKGNIVHGLVKRRVEESHMFNLGQYPPASETM